MKRFFTLTLFSLVVFSSICEENIYERLLAYRLEHSDTYIKIQNEAKIAENQYQQQFLSTFVSTDISAGGGISYTPTSDLMYTVTPGIDISLPSFSNLNLSLSFPITGTVGSSTTSSFSSELNFDIYSKTIQAQALQRKILTEQKNQAVEKRNFAKDLVKTELLSEIKNILNSYLEYLSKQLSKVETSIDFRRLQIEGYGENNTRYKAARLKTLSAERQAETSEKIFLNQVKKFLASCGIAETELGSTDEALLQNITSFFTNLALNIPNEEVISTDDITLETSKKFIQAKSSYENTITERKIQGSLFSLSSTNSLSLPLTGGSKAGSFSSGLNFGFPGGRLSAGITLNFDNLKTPSYSFGIALNPLQIYYKVLNTESEKLQAEIDALSFKTTKDSCEEQVLDTKRTSETLSLSNEAAKYEYEIYSQNAKDVAGLYKNGIVSSLDNSQAQLQETQALVNYAKSKADISIFNIETKQSYIIVETN